MEKTEVWESSVSNGREEEQYCDEFEKSAASFPQEAGWLGTLCQYQGFWFPSKDIARSVFSFQQHFQPLDYDIILASIPKSGTTWIKALTFAIVNRSRHNLLQESPLNTSSPHDIVPSIEFELYIENTKPNLEELLLPGRRMLGTHIPYQMLPSSVKKLDSKCRIVYVCRNPLDQLISYWQFCLKIRKEDAGAPPSLEEGFEGYCRGVHGFGPLVDHVLGYWEASLEKPDKVMFFKYEDMKADIVSQTKRLAEFIGFPFSGEEEEGGVIEEICRFCSFENLKSLEANQSGRIKSGVEKSVFFRIGKVGDWKQHLSPSHAEYFENKVEEKLNPHGLSLKVPREGCGKNNTS